MPLYAGSAVPPPPPPGPVVVTPWREDVGTMRATWTTPLGEVLDLSDISPERGWFTTNQVAGWGARPWEIVTDPMSRGGESVRFLRAQPSRLTWPLHIWGDTFVEFTERYRTLRRAIMMTVHRGLPGQLTVALPDSRARVVDCFYEEGFAGESGQNWLWASPVLTLFCPDGSWRDTQRTVVQRGGSTPVPFNSPFLQISSAQVLGAAEIDNPGDIHAWPEWTITGPCTSVTATNSTTGQSFTLTHTLSPGEVITITTDRPTVRGPAGENLSGSLNWPTAYLWGLVPGMNNVTFTVAGSTSVTAIELGFYPRYEGV